MKSFFLSVFLTIINFTTIVAQGEQLFDDDFLHEIRLEGADTAQFITTKSYQMLKLSVDGEVLDSVGMKRKGNISGYPETNKYGLKIKTNKYVKGKTYDGIKEFTLHMNYQDPSMLREKLTYDICGEMGLYTLRTAFAKVFINDVYWGLYTLVEGKDEMYKHIFDNRDANAIESLDFGNMCYVGDNVEDYRDELFPRYQFENGDEATAWPAFITMLEKVNNTSPASYLEEAAKELHLRDFFTYQAINVYLMNFDSYIGFLGNQIYVYDSLQMKWQVTPWDFNASFGLWNTNNHEPDSYDILPNTITNGCIASKMNEVPELRAYYLDAICQLANSLANEERMAERIDFFYNQIKEAVYSDTRKVIPNAVFDTSIDSQVQNLFGEEVPALKAFISTRNQLAMSRLNELSYSCLLSNKEELVNERDILQLSPNPVNDQLHLKQIKTTTEIETLIIYNWLGQELKRMTFSTPLNVASLAKGSYILSAVLENGQQVNSIFIKG